MTLTSILTRGIARIARIFSSPKEIWVLLLQHYVIVGIIVRLIRDQQHQRPHIDIDQKKRLIIIIIMHCSDVIMNLMYGEVDELPAPVFCFFCCWNLALFHIHNFFSRIADKCVDKASSSEEERRRLKILTEDAVTSFV
jgi:hypothetical protein